MRKSSLSLSVMSALAAAGAMVMPAAVSESANVMNRRVMRRSTPRATGRRYPEQSSRQAMRGSRRAQGGPGIVLIDGAYVRN